MTSILYFLEVSFCIELNPVCIDYIVYNDLRGSLNSQVASEGGCGTEWPGFNSRWEWVFFSAHPSFPHSATTVGI
jgi:hypothetical protein